MLEKMMMILNDSKLAKNNKFHKEDMIADATAMYNAGWDNLKDGIVITRQNRKVAIKKGNTIVINEMDDFNINMGVIDGNVKKQINVIEIPENKKAEYLAQAIITKYYTVREI